MTDTQLLDLLAAVADSGSISAAARSLKISYRTAWERAQAMNNLSQEPVFERRAGGLGGGGSTVTDHGQALLRAYRHLCLAQTQTSAELTRIHPELAHFAPMMRYLRLRTSARNQYAGIVESVVPGVVNTEIVVALADGLRLRAMITEASAQALQLAPGKPVLALVKAQLVVLATGEPPITSAGNCLAGKVDQITPGAVNNEVVLALPGERSLTASIAKTRCKEMGLEVGHSAYALFNANSVIIGVAD